MSEMANELRILACNGRLLAEIVSLFGKSVNLIDHFLYDEEEHNISH